MLLPGVYGQSQVDIFFENLFSTLKNHRHFTSYPILCPCMFSYQTTVLNHLPMGGGVGNKHSRR